MSEIERLQELEQEEKKWYSLFFEQRVVVTKKLYEILDQLNLGPLPLIIPKEDNPVDVSDDYHYGAPQGKWRVSENVYFKSPTDGKDYDFGSSFNLYITDIGITVNHGSCGEWGLEDKGQWTRLLLMKAIFDHQQDIIDALNPLIDLEVREKFHKANNEIYEIKLAIRKAEEEAAEQELRKKLKIGMYIARKSWNYVYPNGYDKPGVKQWYWYDLYQIAKVTDKLIIAHECTSKGNPYTWYKKHLPIKDTMARLKSGSQFLVEDLSIPPVGEEE